MSKVKQIDFTVVAAVTCGSETISLDNSMTHIEAIYATGNSGDTYTINAADILSNYYSINDGTGSCSSPITWTWQDSTG